MIYYVTTLLLLDEENGDSSVEEAINLISCGEQATVRTSQEATEVLKFFGLNDDQAEDRILFAKTGMSFVAN